MNPDRPAPPPLPALPKLPALEALLVNHKGKSCPPLTQPSPRKRGEGVAVGAFTYKEGAYTRHLSAAANSVAGRS